MSVYWPEAGLTRSPLMNSSCADFVVVVVIVLGPFNDRRDALTDADAHGSKSALGAARFHGMQQRHHDACATASQRSTNRDRTTVDFDPLKRNFEFANAGDGLCSERLVHLDQVDVIDAQIRAHECLLGRRDGAETHAVRVDARDSRRYDAPHGFEPAALCFVCRHQHNPRRTIIDATRITRGHGAAFAKNGLEFSQLFHGHVRPRRLVDDDYSFGGCFAVTGYRYAEELAIEGTRALRIAGLVLAREGKLILCSARDAIALCDVLRSFAHTDRGITFGCQLGIVHTRA